MPAPCDFYYLCPDGTKPGKMKIRSIDSASLLIAGTATVISIGAGMATGIDGWITAGIGMATFLLTGLAARAVIKKFVIYKIKPIYQIVLARNIKTRELEEALAHKTNLVEEVGADLSAYAERNRQEILRLQENERYRKEFLGNVSHEIKTPIFNIQGYILTLLDGALEDKTINRKYLERSEKSIDRLINIVNDLEEISKLESGSLHLQIETFDVVALAREIADATEMEASKKGITLQVGHSTTVPAQPIQVKADRRHIGQVLVNLLVNSIKYGKEGGLTKISFIDLFDKVMIEVSDNGIGIASEDVPRVFERFYRADKSRSREMGGTGLGLSIVKHIMEAHHETITLRSELGQGSTFSFTLPKA